MVDILDMEIDQQGRVVRLVPENPEATCDGCVYEPYVTDWGCIKHHAPVAHLRGPIPKNLPVCAELAAVYTLVTDNNPL